MMSVYHKNIYGRQLVNTPQNLFWADQPKFNNKKMSISSRGIMGKRKIDN